MRHRADIDGLRALAVLPILLFHAGFSLLPGGFAGVDIFFVISGFLITSIITREMEDGSFTIVAFYRRRIVRIFPALLVMLVAVLVVGCLTMLPVEVDELGRSAAAASAFGANIFFWREADYFGGAAETKPLLHTWSLGVEEQFYIFYPLFLMLVGRFSPEYIRRCLLGLAASSFLLCIGMTIKQPEAAFYLLPSRVWELCFGGLVAVDAFPKVQSPSARSALALIGLALIIGAILAIRPGEWFPVPTALAPCLGATLLIAYGERSAVGKGLAAGPLRAIGFISYSAYLWHWPIIAFYRLETGSDLIPTETAILISASIGAAYLSYRFVEVPFMKRFRSTVPRRVITVGISAVVGGVGVATLVWLNADQWRSFSPEVRRIAAYGGYRAMPDYAYQFRPGPCFRRRAESATPFDPRTCLSIDAARRNLVVLGDSQAAQYWRAFALTYPARNVIQATASGCRPTIEAEGAQRCVEVVSYALGPLLQTGKVDTVVISARWTREEIPRLLRTVQLVRKANASAVVIGPTVEYEGELPALLARASMHGTTADVSRLQVRSRFELDQQMAKEVARAGGLYISATGIECPKGKCRLFAPDQAPMHFDYSHLTLSGARWLVGQMPRL